MTFLWSFLFYPKEDFSRDAAELLWLAIAIHTQNRAGKPQHVWKGKVSRQNVIMDDSNKAGLGAHRLLSSIRVSVMEYAPWASGIFAHPVCRFIHQQCRIWSQENASFRRTQYNVCVDVSLLCSSPAGMVATTPSSGTKFSAVCFSFRFAFVACLTYSTEEISRCKITVYLITKI